MPEIDAGNGPLLVFGGPYGNLQATKALIQAAEGHGIPAERLICTGDLAAYCADPAATVSMIRNSGMAVIQGNVEESLAVSAADCGCGFAAGSDCDVLSERWYAYASAEIDRKDREWMADLPRRLDVRLGGVRLAIVHGAPSAINRFVFPGTPAAEKQAELAGLAVDGVIGGHSGLPFAERLGTQLWHNAGVIGLPANDGTPRVWYSILEWRNGGLVVSIHALSYDHCAAVAAVRTAGLPEAYAVALESGLWPNDDIMPASDRARRGIPLRPSRQAVLPGQREARDAPTGGRRKGLIGRTAVDLMSPG